MLFMLLWFGFSGCTLFGNKHILSTLKADPNVLAVSQMTMTATFGAVKMYGPCLTGLGPAQPTPLSTQSLSQFLACMSLVGLMRVVTVMLGLVSLKYVAVSFTETIKSSAPFFTVIFARLMLGEVTSARVRPAPRPRPQPRPSPHPSPSPRPSPHPWAFTPPLARAQVNLSLVPVVAGLALCSASEISFNMVRYLVITPLLQHGVRMWHLHVACPSACSMCMWAGFLTAILTMAILSPGGLLGGGLQQRHRLRAERLLEEAPLHTLQLRQPTGEA